MANFTVTEIKPNFFVIKTNYLVEKGESKERTLGVCINGKLMDALRYNIGFGTFVEEGPTSRRFIAEKGTNCEATEAAYRALTSNDPKSPAARMIYKEMMANNGANKRDYRNGSGFHDDGGFNVEEMKNKYGFQRLLNKDNNTVGIVSNRRLFDNWGNYLGIGYVTSAGNFSTEDPVAKAAAKALRNNAPHSQAGWNVIMENDAEQRLYYDSLVDTGCFADEGEIS